MHLQPHEIQIGLEKKGQVGPKNKVVSLFQKKKKNKVVS